MSARNLLQLSDLIIGRYTQISHDSVIVRKFTNQMSRDTVVYRVQYCTAQYLLHYSVPLSLQYRVILYCLWEKKSRPRVWMGTLKLPTNYCTVLY